MCVLGCMRNSRPVWSEQRERGGSGESEWNGTGMQNKGVVRIDHVCFASVKQLPVIKHLLGA